jgi:hypothetical protein
MILKAKTKNSGASSSSAKKSKASQDVKTALPQKKAESFSYTDFMVAGSKASVKSKKAVVSTKVKKTGIKTLSNKKNDVKLEKSKTKRVGIKATTKTKPKIAIKKIGAVKAKSEIGTITSIKKQVAKKAVATKTVATKARSAKAGIKTSIKSGIKSSVSAKVGIKTVKAPVKKIATKTVKAVVKKGAAVKAVVKKTVKIKKSVKSGNVNISSGKNEKKIGGKKSVKKINK